MALPVLTTLSLCFTAGIALAVLARVSSAAAGLIVVLAAASMLVRERQLAPRLPLHMRAGFAGLGVLLAVLGLQSRAQDCRHLLRDGQATSLTGVLLEASPRSAWLSLTAIGQRPCSGMIRMLSGRMKSGSVWQAGQMIRVQGEWWSNLNADRLAAPGGMLALQSWEPAGGRALMPATRGRAAARIASLFGEQAPLAGALLIAQRDQIDPRVKQDFAASGLSHLLAISGTHVALVAMVFTLLAAMARLPNAAGSLLAGLASTGYVLFLGAPYPAVRAALQILFVLVARALQRPAHPFALLAAAGLCILVYDPLALLDAGFQLSFGGLLGIMLWRRPLIEWQPHSLPLVVRDAIATSAAASLATTPIAAFHFGQISFIAIPANLVALPLVTLAVPAAAFALALSAVSMPVAQFCADGTRLLLARLEDTAALAAAVPGGHVFITRASVLAGLAGLLLGYAAWQQLWFLKRAARSAVALGMACLVPIAAPVLSTGSRHSIEIHAIDVGQGDAIAIRSPGGRWLLIDAGPASERFNAGSARVVPFLLQHGARALEVLVLTHPHLDHFGGAAAVTRVLETGLVLDPDSGRSVRAATGENSPRIATRAWLPARAGARIAFDGLSIDVLHPAAAAIDASADPNDYSIVIRLGFGQFSALLSGDAPSFVEDDLMNRHGPRLDVDLLKVGHHGSNTSTGEDWLSGSTPRFALISAGRGNRYGHPAPAVIERLERAGVQVLRTDRSGNISLRAYRDGRVEVIDP